MIFGNVTRQSKVHGVIRRSLPVGAAQTYYAYTACGKVATLKAGTLQSTLAVTGDEPRRVECQKCLKSLRRKRPELFPTP